jgi:adenylate kinase family enzyme
MCVVVLECPEHVLVQRLGARKRADDTRETIEARIRTFEETTGEVIAKYEVLGKVVRVRSDGDIWEVFEQLRMALEKAGVVLQPR